MYGQLIRYLLAILLGQNLPSLFIPRWSVLGMMGIGGHEVHHVFIQQLSGDCLVQAVTLDLLGGLEVQVQQR